METKKTVIPGTEGGGLVKDQENIENLSGAERFERGRSQEAGETFITAEEIESAQTFADLIRSFRDNYGLVYKNRAKFYYFKFKDALAKMGDIVQYLGKAKDEDPLNLKQSAADLGEAWPKFAAIPEEKGLRAKVMRLYDMRRGELMGDAKVMEEARAVKSPQPVAKDVKPATTPVAAPSNKERKKVVLSPEDLKPFKDRRLGYIATYREALTAAYEKMREKQKQKGFMNIVKRLFINQNPEISEDEQEELRALRHEIDIDRLTAAMALKSLILERGGTEDDVTKAIIELRTEIVNAMTALIKNGEMLQTSATTEYERLVFTKVTPEINFSDGQQRKHTEYLERKKLADEERAAAGAFVPVVTLEAVPVPEPAKEETVAPAPITKPVATPISESKKLKIESADKDGKEEKDGVSPEKTVIALKALEELKQDSKKLSQRAGELFGEGVGHLKKATEWYKALPRWKKIAISCTIASAGLAGAAAASPLLIASALTARTVQRGLLSASASFTVSAAMAVKAKKNREQGKETWWMQGKKQELLAVSTGVALFFLPKIFSSEVGHLIKEAHIGDHIKEWFASIMPSPEVSPENIPLEPNSPIATDIPELEPSSTISPPISLEPDTAISPPVALEPEVPATPEPSPSVPEPTTSTPEIADAAPEIQNEKVLASINDGLGSKGNSVWGALKQSGVSERAIANYEKLHHGEITAAAHNHNGVQFKFEYDKETDTLKEVKFEDVGKLAKKGVVTIKDSLGSKGNSVWGALKQGGVSERAIANYEKLHPGEINRPSQRNGDIIKFIYDRKTDTLQEVKLEKAVGKVAKKAGKLAASTVIEEKQPPHPLPTHAPEQKISSGKTIAHEPTAKSPRIKASKFITRSTPLDLPLPEGEFKAEKSLMDVIDGNAQNISMSPFETADLSDHPKIAVELKNFFGGVKDKSWRIFSGADASKVLSTSNADALKKILGKDISVQDTKSGKVLFQSILKESGLKLKKNEKVMDFMLRAVEKLSKVPQK